MKDNILIELLHQKDESAFVELEKKYGSFCRSIGSQILSDKKDVEQCKNTVFLHVFNEFSKSNQFDLKIIIGRKTRNTAIEIASLKSYKKQRGKQTNIIFTELDNCFLLDNSLEHEQNKKYDINRYLVNLDKESRVFFIRRYWFFETISEIALKHDTSKNIVKSYLSGSLAGLKKYFEENDALNINIDCVLEAINNISDEFINEVFEYKIQKKSKSFLVTSCITILFLLTGLFGTWLYLKDNIKPDDSTKNEQITLPDGKPFTVQDIHDFIEIKEENRTFIFDPDVKYSFGIPETVKEITKPFFLESTYYNGKIYVEAAEGYDNDYIKSICGGWHDSDAWLKVWYEYDPSAQSLIKTDLKNLDEINNKDQYIYDNQGYMCFSALGFYNNRRTGGYYINPIKIEDNNYSQRDIKYIEIKYNDIINGEDRLLYIDNEHNTGAIRAINNDYLIFSGSCNSDNSYSELVVFSIETNEPVLKVTERSDDIEQRFLFMYKDKIYFIHNDCLIYYDIQTKERNNVVESGNIDLPNNMYEIFVSNSYALFTGNESKSKNGLYYINTGEIENQGDPVDILKKIYSITNNESVYPLKVNENDLFYAVATNSYSENGISFTVYKYNVSEKKHKKVFKIDDWARNFLIIDDHLCISTKFNIYTVDLLNIEGGDDIDLK